MKQILLTVTILTAAGAAACTKTSTTPSTTTTTAPATTTTTTAATTSTTTTTAVTQFTMSGLVSDDATGKPVPLAEIEFFEGPNTGQIFHADASGLYSAPNLNPGAFAIRVRGLGYNTLDVRGVMPNANLRVDVQLHLTPITTTTTSTIAPTLHAAFTWAPDPCTISGATPVTDCTVDATSSTGATGYSWTYGSGKTVTNNARFKLQLACGDLNGTGTDVNVNVSLTVTDAGGGTDGVTKSVPVTKINGACP